MVALAAPLSRSGRASGWREPPSTRDLIYQTNWLTHTVGTKRLCLSPSRIYDPETGRFLSRDPLQMIAKVAKGGGLGSVLGIFERTRFASTILEVASRKNWFLQIGYTFELNGYVYALAQPTHWFDALGLIEGIRGTWTFNVVNGGAHITYHLNATEKDICKPCKKYWLVQFVKGEPSLKWKAQGGESIDRNPENTGSGVSPFFGRSASGNPKEARGAPGGFRAGTGEGATSAYIWDNPGGNANRLELETCAICIDPAEIGLLECRKWRFIPGKPVTDLNEAGQPYPATQGPQLGTQAAVDEWNDWAKKTNENVIAPENRRLKTQRERLQDKRPEEAKAIKDIPEYPQFNYSISGNPLPPKE